jgi:sec-independent protein translocase protein TatA
MPTGLLIGGVGPPELLIVGVIVVLLFGASKIPELARSMGKAKAEYKKGAREAEEELEADDEDEDEAAEPSRA